MKLKKTVFLQNNTRWMHFYDFAESVRADCGGEYDRIADLFADDGPVAGNATASRHSVCAPLLNLGAAPALPRNTPVWRKDCRRKLLEHADLYNIERCDRLRLEFGVNSDVGAGLDFVTYRTEGDGALMLVSYPVIVENVTACEAVISALEAVDEAALRVCFPVATQEALLIEAQHLAARAARWKSIDDMSVRKRVLCLFAPFLVQHGLYPDRLGTNVGKTQKPFLTFLQAAEKASVRRLGWDDTTWEDGDVAPMATAWDQLTEGQLADATMLGYCKESWMGIVDPLNNPPAPVVPSVRSPPCHHTPAITRPMHTTHTQLHCPLMKNPCG